MDVSDFNLRKTHVSDKNWKQEMEEAANDIHEINSLHSFLEQVV
jgi:hypothetical protein